MFGKKHKQKKLNKKAFKKLKLKQHSIPADETVVFVCKKCGRDLKDAEGKNPSPQLVDEITTQAAARGLTNFRCELSGCMDLCPKAQVAVGIGNAALVERERIDCHAADVADLSKAATEVFERLDVIKAKQARKAALETLTES